MGNEELLVLGRGFRLACDVRLSLTVFGKLDLGRRGCLIKDAREGFRATETFEEYEEYARIILRYEIRSSPSTLIPLIQSGETHGMTYLTHNCAGEGRNSKLSLVHQRCGVHSRCCHEFWF